ITLHRELVLAPHGQIEVQLLWYPRVGPGRFRQLGDVLDREAGLARAVPEHEPVLTARIGISGGRGFVAGSILVTEKLSIELSDSTRVSGVEDNGTQRGIALGHRPRMPRRSGTRLAIATGSGLLHEVHEVIGIFDGHGR